MCISKKFYDMFDSSMSDELKEELECLDIEQVAALVGILTTSWVTNHKKVYMQGVDGAPDWFLSEHEIWALGEVLRQLLKKRKKWRAKTILMDIVEKVARNSLYGKGRQTFVLLLGGYGGGFYVNTLGTLLSDKEVYGYAIEALIKTKSNNYIVEVEKIAAHESGWIKKAAKKYLSLNK